MATKKKPSPAQLAARKLFAKRAKAGAFARKPARKTAAKKRVVKKNPAPAKRARKIPVGEAKEIRADYQVRVSEGLASDGGPGKWRTIAYFPGFKEAKEYALSYANAYNVQMSVVNLKTLGSWY